VAPAPAKAVGLNCHDIPPGQVPATLSGVLATKDVRGHPDKGPHTVGFAGTFFEGGGNQLKWPRH
ncbi:MAG: hypothetical protein ACR2P3_10750, partial [Geminicoccaceae bacterium]